MAYASTKLETGSGTREFFFRPRTSDEHVFQQVFVNQEYNLAGANIGASSIYFAVNAWGSRVVAIEPDRKNFELLEKNVEGLKEIELVRAALSSSKGQAVIVDPGLGPWGYRTRPAAAADSGPKTVASVTMNEIFEERAADFYPLIAKIDIEGAEEDLFSANTEWVVRTPLIIIELHDWLLPKAGTSAPFLRCIAGLSRDFMYFGENIFSLAHDLEAAGR
jgi:FkbM family methyltransferase